MAPADTWISSGANARSWIATSVALSGSGSPAWVRFRLPSVVCAGIWCWTIDTLAPTRNGKRVLVGLVRVVGAVGRSHESRRSELAVAHRRRRARTPVATAQVGKMAHDTRRLPLSLTRDGS